MTARRLWVLAGIGLWCGPAHAACDGAPTVDDLMASLGAAEQALTLIDIAAFKAETQHSRELVPCLGEPITRPAAARLHRVEGLSAFGDRDPHADRSFAAARQIEPSYRFPRTLVPRGSPVHDSYAAVATDSLEFETAPAPAEGVLNIDGRTSRQRAVTLPSVVQHVDASGTVAFTAYLKPGDPLPSYAERTDDVPVTADVVAADQWRSMRVPFAVAMAGTGVVAGTLYGLSLSGKARYADVEGRPVDDADLPALRARTNALSVGSAVSGGLMVVSGVLFATTW